MVDTLLKILPAAVLLLWSVRIFMRKDTVKSRLLMSAGMAVATHAIFRWEMSALFVFPFVYLSFREITSSSGISKWDWLIFVPSIAFISLGSRTTCDIFLCVQIAAVLVASAIEVKRYNKLSAEYYDTDDATEVPGQMLLLLTVATIVSAVLMILPDGIRFHEPITITLTLFVTGLLYLFGANADKLGQQPPVSEEAIREAEEAGNGGKKTSTEAGSTANEANRKLLQTVIDEKMYLDPTLSLISLAEKLHTNRTYLSNSIHACYNQNFSDFINHLRISHAVKLMKEDGREANIKDIAIRSGYNHIQSFYRNFTQILDMTPKTWISKQQ